MRYRAATVMQARDIRSPAAITPSPTRRPSGPRKRSARPAKHKHTATATAAQSKYRHWRRFALSHRTCSSASIRSRLLISWVTPRSLALLDLRARGGDHGHQPGPSLGRLGVEPGSARQPLRNPGVGSRVTTHRPRVPGQSSVRLPRLEPVYVAQRQVSTSGRIMGLAHWLGSCPIPHFMSYKWCRYAPQLREWGTALRLG
jgi:hypothetical protein